MGSLILCTLLAPPIPPIISSHGYMKCLFWVYSTKISIMTQLSGVLMHFETIGKGQVLGVLLYFTKYIDTRNICMQYKLRCGVIYDDVYHARRSVSSMLRLCTDFFPPHTPSSLCRDHAP